MPPKAPGAPPPKAPGTPPAGGTNKAPGAPPPKAPTAPPPGGANKAPAAPPKAPGAPPAEGNNKAPPASPSSKAPGAPPPNAPAKTPSVPPSKPPNAPPQGQTPAKAPSAPPQKTPTEQTDSGSTAPPNVHAPKKAPPALQAPPGKQPSKAPSAPPPGAPPKTPPAENQNGQSQNNIQSSVQQHVVSPIQNLFHREQSPIPLERYPLMTPDRRNFFDGDKLVMQARESRYQSSQTVNPKSFCYEAPLVSRTVKAAQPQPRTPAHEFFDSHEAVQSSTLLVPRETQIHSEPRVERSAYRDAPPLWTDAHYNSQLMEEEEQPRHHGNRSYEYGGTRSAPNHENHLVRDQDEMRWRAPIQGESRSYTVGSNQSIAGIVQRIGRDGRPVYLKVEKVRKPQYYR